MEVWVPAVFAFAGVALGKICEVIVEKIKLRGKKDDAMTACKKEHAEKLDKVRDEFNKKLDSQDAKLDEQDAKIDQISETLIEVKSMLQNLSSLFEIMSGRVEKHNNVIERTFKLEEKQASDHERIERLERREETRL
jgi:septal ring factor EnvC (AmiA/AmiB activator)